MTEPTDSQTTKASEVELQPKALAVELAKAKAHIAALRGFVVSHLAAIDSAILQVPHVVPREYQARLAQRVHAAAAAAVAAGLDAPAAAQLGASIKADVDAALQAHAPKAR